MAWVTILRGIMAFLQFPPGRRPYGPEAKPPGPVFSVTYLCRSFALFPLLTGFPPLINHEKTAPSDSAEPFGLESFDLEALDRL